MTIDGVRAAIEWQKQRFSPVVGTQSLFRRFKLTILNEGREPMLSLLLNHSPAFVIGELMLALSLGMFGFALVGTVREKYSIEVPGVRIRNRPTR